MDGMEVCREVRRKSSVPVIMLTASDSEVDRVLALEIGADDYVTKPVSMRELLARIAPILRRTEGEQPSLPDREALDNFVLDRAARVVSLDGVDVPLARREFELLSFLLGTPGRTHTRDALIRRVWGSNFAGDRKTVDVHIRWLRERFMGRAPFDIVTVRGLGYRLDLREEQKANG